MSDGRGQLAAKIVDVGISFESWPMTKARGPATIERIPWSGGLLCLWNDHTGWHNHPPDPRRSPLSMTISNDEGATWAPSRVLDGKWTGSYC